MSFTTLSEPASICPLTQNELDFYRENGYGIIYGLFDREEMELVQKVYQSDPNLESAFKRAIDNQGRSWGASVWPGLNDQTSLQGLNEWR
jgi:ectoine hydroxylase